MCEHGEIMVKIIVQLPHLSYCDSSTSQNLATKLGISIDNIMIKHPSKFDGMSMKRVWVRNNNLDASSKIRAIASGSKQKRFGANWLDFVALLRYNEMDMLLWQLSVGHAQFWRGCITFLFFTLLVKLRYHVISTENCWAQLLNFLWFKNLFLCFHSFIKKHSWTCSGYQKWMNLIKIEWGYKWGTGVQKATISWRSSPDP